MPGRHADVAVMPQKQRAFIITDDANASAAAAGRRAGQGPRLYRRARSGRRRSAQMNGRRRRRSRHEADTASTISARSPAIADDIRRAMMTIFS